MPDRDIFEDCAGKKQRKALNSIYRDWNRSDPSVIPNTVAAAEERFIGLDDSIRQLADWVFAKSEPMPLLDRVGDVPIAALPIELRAAFEYATLRTERHVIGSNPVQSKQYILAQILSHAMVRLIAENSCAIAMARQELHLTAQEIRQRLLDLASELIKSSSLSDFAARVLQSSVDDAIKHVPPRRKRGRNIS
ncbi:MAG: hypothetical protein M3457_17090, partial [Chloroflexota bacterium]|nr:hypothetical protein [Chloroflexota bacterium]